MSILWICFYPSVNVILFQFCILDILKQSEVRTCNFHYEMRFNISFKEYIDIYVFPAVSVLLVYVY